jgi:mono/diheme cytochrome c family protein
MKRMFKWLSIAVLGAVLLFWYLTQPDTIPPGDMPDHDPDPVNGEVIFHAGGCASCHEVDLGGGLEMSTAFGTFRVPNISPDPVTGIGGWNMPDFVNAMMRGVSPDGRHYYPAFPYVSYARMMKGDVMDLKAYLDTLEPVSRIVAGHELRFPWSLQRGIGLWKRRYLDSAPVITSTGLGQAAGRGRYLVEGAGHCAECHTPRDPFGGLVPSRWLAGAPNPDGEGTVPNITPGEDGLGSWTEADIAYYLESGFLPDFDTVGGSMVEVQENMALLPDSDREAIAAYLKSIPARASNPD